MKKIMSKEKRLLHSDAGFTLIEVAIVIVIVGILTIPLVSAYSIYQQKRAMEITTERIKTISDFTNITKDANLAYPCPALRNLVEGDAMYGVDACTNNTLRVAIDGLALGACTAGGGICKIAGIRDADGDSINDPILIGAVPFVTLAIGTRQFIGADNSYDGWNNKIDYAVSANITRLSGIAAPLNESHFFGVIKAVDEFGRPTASIGTIDINNDSIIDDDDANGLYVIISHGKTGLGAYSSQGRLVAPCSAASTDRENCDNDATFMRALGVYEGTPAQFYDDYVLFNREQAAELWQNVTNPATNGGTGDIINLNTGFVGIGTDTPSEELEVVGNIRAPTVLSNQICDETGANCLDVNYFITSLTSGAKTNTCSSSGSVIKGIANGKVTCEKVLIQNSGLHTCPVGEHVRGMYTDGRVICTDLNIY